MSALGCATGSSSNTARTSIEQLLLANAVDQSLDKVNFSYFAGSNVFLQDKYMDCVDKNYIIASTRHRLLTAGALLVDDVAKADVVVEMRAGAVGTNFSNTFLGTPEIALPGMLTVPELKVAERRRQDAVAKLGLVAYDPKTNAILGTGGTTLSSSTDSNWFVAGVGPYRSGSVQKEVKDSTTGVAAQTQEELPHYVAFAAPKPMREEPVQLAAEEPAAKATISPASHETDDQPDWAGSLK
ncbi:MAG TPA: DUF6655 family protein [Planctomicrobium sp.]|nr:DUF6655 family protein [Planctomicrobium sp.]